MFKLKKAAERVSALLAAASLLGGMGAATFAPALASADALNPLTERSLTLSSSSPGWSYTDGSGNVYDPVISAGFSPYAAPNTGSNGDKTGETIGFRVSSNATIKAIDAQFCTSPSGNCTSPGDDAATVDHPGNTGTGTITLTNGGTAVTGSGTHFLSQLGSGYTITTAGGHTYTIASNGISDDTDLTITAGAAAAESGVAFTYDYKTNAGDTGSTSDYNITSSGTPDTGTNSGTNGDLTGANGDSVHSTWIEGNYTTIQSDPGQVPDPAGGFSGSFASGVPVGHTNPGDIPGQYVVLTSNDGSSWTQSTGWSLTATNNESPGGQTGKNNYYILANPTGVALPPGKYVKIIFYATYGGYITNPGSGAFFARLNTYNAVSNTDSQYVSGANVADFPYVASVNPADVVDGGVTVANVMNESIQIQTKVLETMDFSVGTVDPDTLSSTQLNTAIGTPDPGVCNPIQPSLSGTGDPQKNTLLLGNPTASDSLSTNGTFATHSYFRLSTNSSKGATVYYSGNTLTDTEGDQIAPIGTSATLPSPGSEQFGLALDNGDTASSYPINYAFARNYNSVQYEQGDDSAAAGYTTGTEDGGADSGTGLSYNWTHNKPLAAHDPGLYPLLPATGYGDNSGGTAGLGGADDGTGSFPDGINSLNHGAVEDIESHYAFDSNSNTVPAALASESNTVLACATGKVRYIANIAATTPAGIYTTKVNYIAAPKY